MAICDPLRKARQFRKVADRRNSAQVKAGVRGNRFDQRREFAEVHSVIIPHPTLKDCPFALTNVCPNSLTYGELQIGQELMRNSQTAQTRHTILSFSR